MSYCLADYFAVVYVLGKLGYGIIQNPPGLLQWSYMYVLCLIDTQLMTNRATMDYISSLLEQEQKQTCLSSSFSLHCKEQSLSAAHLLYFPSSESEQFEVLDYTA